MARTRRQVTLQEQESGVPASPPQSLPNATRSIRAKRTTTRNNTTAAPVGPAEPPPSTRGGPVVRSGRISRAKKVGRGRSKPMTTTSHDEPESSAVDADANEASDSSTHEEVAEQASSTAQEVFDNVKEVEGMKEQEHVEPPGETHFPTDVSAHPVQVQGMTAHPVQGPTTPQEAHESATSQKFRDILNASPRSPGLSSAPLTPTTVVPVVPLQSTLDTPLAAPTSTQVPPVVAPVVQSTLDTALAAPTSTQVATTVAPVAPLKSTLVTPLAAPTSTTTDTPVVPLNSTLDTPLAAPTSTEVAPVSSSPLSKPSQRVPSPMPKPKFYFVPSNPERSHTLITLHMDHIQGSKDPVRSPKPASFVVPSEIVAPLCRYIESRARPGSDLSKLTTDHPVVNSFVYGDARYRPQLPSWQSQQSPPLPGSTMRDAFIKKIQRKRGFREMEEETAALKAENVKLMAKATEASRSSAPQTKKNEASQLLESPQKRTKTVPDPYTDDGQLLLGRTKEIEVDEYGVALNPMDEPSLRWKDEEARKKAQLEEARRIANLGESPYVAEETPNTDGPALGGVFADSQEQVEPEQVPETPRARGWGLSGLLPSARSITRYIPFSTRRAISTPQQQPPQPQRLAQTQPRVDAGSPPSQPDTDAASSVAGPVLPGHRHHQSTSNQQRLLTKEQSEEEKRIKKLRAQLRKEADALEKQKKDFEIAKKDLAEKQKAAEIVQTPGKKRKRVPSPDVIPLPAGGGFGLIDEYFIVDSSSDEDEAMQETPTKEPAFNPPTKEPPFNPFKRARTRALKDPVVGSPFRARPYTGTLFAHPDALRSPDDNSFVDADRPDTYPASKTTPPPGPTLVFKVPSPGSSDDDDDENGEQEQINKTTPEASSPRVTETRSILRNSTLHSSQSQQRGTANSPSPLKTMAAPPRPSSGHATLPPGPAMAPSGALEKAREKALRHQPKQPSTLRESSRLSTSTVNSDAGDQADSDEYDPAHPAIVPSPSKISVFAQAATPAAPAFGHLAVSHTAPTGLQQPITPAVSEQAREQQNVPDTSGKQSLPTNNVLTAARAVDVPLNGQQVPMEKQNERLDAAAQVSASRRAEIRADMDRYWEEHGDDYVLDDGYEEFEEELIAEEQELMDGPNGSPYTQPQNIVSAAFDRIGADGLSDRGIQTDIEDNWRPGDLERTQSDPANGMRVFFNRLVKKGDIERELADKVIAMGVPPGITEYLAGPGVKGPVAA